MHNYRMMFITLLVVLMTALGLAAWSQDVLTYSNSELDEILAPIALYPDPLIAQILPAATYPDQLADADDFIQQYGSSPDIDIQNWDLSVKAVAYYPSVLQMMVDKPDWTVALGQAYVDEPDHVMLSIQRLRARARTYGYLSTNSYQRVYDESGYIRIVPVQAQYIYVPSYDPQIVYTHRRSSYSSNIISFGLGLLIGSWLDRDVDWGHHRVYYHGWNGGGWIGRSRSRVSINNKYYVNNDYRNRSIDVDRNVRSRSLGDFRAQIRRNAGTYRLPESRQPSRVRNRAVPERPRTIAPNTPNVAPQRNSRTGRTNVPRVIPSPRPGGDVTSPSTTTRRNINRRRPTGSSNNPSVTTSPGPSGTTSTPGRTINRRRPTGNTNNPSVVTSPRSGQSATGSKGNSGNRSNRSRGNKGSNKGQTGSESKSNGNDNNNSRSDSNGR